MISGLLESVHIKKIIYGKIFNDIFIVFQRHLSSLVPQQWQTNSIKFNILLEEGINFSL